MAITAAYMKKASSIVQSVPSFSRQNNIDAFAAAGRYVPNTVTAGTRINALNATEGWIVKGSFLKCRSFAGIVPSREQFS
jgi:hypothetical protein